MENIKNITFAVLEEMTPDKIFKGIELWKAVHEKSSKIMYPATVLHYARDWRDLPDNPYDLVNIDRQKSTYIKRLKV